MRREKGGPSIRTNDVMMLAMRLLSAARGGSESQDVRTVDSVLAAAAKRLGEPPTPAVSRQLEANGVRFAWQMAHFSDTDWDQLGVSLGMKTAAKAELADPSASTPPDSKQCYKSPEELTDRMRRFLLLPDAEGREAKPLRSMSSLFCAILATPVGDRQSLLLALCERASAKVWVSGTLPHEPAFALITHQLTQSLHRHSPPQSGTLPHEPAFALIIHQLTQSLHRRSPPQSWRSSAACSCPPPSIFAPTP